MNENKLVGEKPSEFFSRISYSVVDNIELEPTQIYETKLQCANSEEEIERMYNELIEKELEDEWL